MPKTHKIKHPKLHNPIEKHFDDLSRYHKYVFALIYICNILVTWHVLSLLFLSPPIDFNCDIGDDDEVILVNNRCPCSDPIWNRTVFKETARTKFNVLCENDWMISFSESAFNCGLLVGALVLGVLSDLYGRVTTFAIASFTLTVFGSLVSAMPVVSAYILMRFFEGVGGGGAMVTAYVLCVEYCGVRQREAVTALYHVPINVGHISLAGISYFLRDCDEFQLALSIPTGLLVALKWLVMESPKWLMDNGHLDQATEVMEKFCKFNGKPCDHIREELEAYQASHTTTHAKMQFWHIFRYKKLTLNFICISVNYFVCGMGYYGVSQFIGKMSGNIHLNVAISGTLILPGTISSVFFLKMFGRRPFLMVTNFLSGIFIIGTVLVPLHIGWLRVLLACISNCFYFMSFIIVFLFGVELFPTKIRNSTLGILSVLSRVGQILAPPINSMSELTAGIVFGVMAMISGLLCYPLPETKNIELPSSLEETQTLPRNRTLLEEDSDFDVGTSQ